MVVFNVIAPYSKRDLKVIKIILDAQILSSCFLRLLTSHHGLSTTPQRDEGLNFSDEPITNCDWSLDSGLDLFFQVTFLLMMLQGEFFVLYLTGSALNTMVPSCCGSHLPDNKLILAQLWSDVIIYVAQCRKITLV